MQSFSVRAPFIHTSLKAFYAEKTEANPPGQASAIRNTNQNNPKITFKIQ